MTKRVAIVINGWLLPTGFIVLFMLYVIIIIVNICFIFLFITIENDIGIIFSVAIIIISLMVIFDFIREISISPYRGV